MFAPVIDVNKRSFFFSFQKMEAGAIVHALYEKYGFVNRRMNRYEDSLYKQIVEILEDKMEIIEEVRTLGFAGDSDESDDGDYGDDVFDEEMPSTSQGSQTHQESPTPVASSGEEYQPSPKKQKHILDDDYKEAAYMFWTHNENPEKKRRKFSSVKSQYRLIQSKNILFEYEKKRQKPSYKKLNAAVHDKFKEMVERCAIIHDRTLRFWALQISKELDPDNTLQFKASRHWLSNFKKRNNIVSRSITHRVSKTWKSKEAELNHLSTTFITSMKELMLLEDLNPRQVLNADQSRFDKELHAYRTHRTKGTVVVRGAFGSVSATTHSYMIMPVISMDGEILRPMYVLVSESSGQFPGNKQKDPDNIVSHPGKTANMNKSDLKEFYSVFWNSLPADRDKVLLLLDSWSANKDDNVSNELCPNHITLFKRLIPGGCTGFIQPLDVYFFRPYKSFIRFITDTVIASSEINLWHRDNILRMQSFTLFQFSASRFRNMIRFAFYKSGYLDEEPEPWISPLDYCFDSNIRDECYKTSCENISFVKCAHCEQSICLSHAFIDDLHIDCINV